MKLSSYKKSILFPMSLLMISGCGGDNNSSSENNQPDPIRVPVKAYNAFSVVEPNKTTTIDMTQHTENAKTLTIASVLEHCPEPEVDGIKITVSYAHAQYCDYQYRVTSRTGEQANSTLSLLATSAAEAILPPHSAPIIAHAGQLHTFNLSEILADEWLPSFSLNSDVQISGNDSIGAVTVSGNSIHYTAISEPTWNTVTYTLADSNDPDNYYIGHIYITLSNEGNQAPHIGMPQYDYNLQTNLSVEAREAVTIDLSALPNLNIQSEDDWALVSVQSFTSDVSIDTSVVAQSKSFSFSTASIGKHTISYIISDQNLGYSPGTITINVTSKEQAKSWSEMKLTSMGNIYTYSSPDLYSEVSPNVNVTPYWDPVVENTIASFTPSQAEYYCSQFGYIPKISELNLLWQRGNLGALDLGDFSQLPKQLNYFARDDKDLTIKKFDFNTGLSSSVVGNESLYLTCLKSDRLKIETLTRRVVANGNSYNVISVDKTAGAVLDIEAVIEANESITLNDIAISTTPIYSDKDLITVSSTKSGNFRLSVSNGNDVLMTPNLAFIGDIDTVGFSDVVIARNAYISGQEDFHDGKFLIANESDTIRFTITLMDVYENAIENALVEVVHNQTDIISANPSADFFSDGQGNITVDFFARESLFASGEYDDKTWSFDFKVNNVVEPNTLPIKHKNFTGRIILENIRYERLYIAATIKVMIGGQLVESTVSTNEGLRGTFMHVAGVEDYVGSFTVPVEGKEVFISTGDNTVEPEMEFTLTGSPFPATLSLPEGLNITRTEKDHAIGLGNVAENDLSTATLLAEFEHYDRINYYRSSSGQPRYIYLPDLSLNAGDSTGKVMMMQNGAGNNARVFSNVTSRYWTMKEKVNTTCMVRGFYWDGGRWVAMNPTIHPEVGDYLTGCDNRF